MICPQCQNDVSVTEAQYLSMYTCPKCQAVYFIDINGQPDYADMSTSEEAFQQDQASQHPPVEYVQSENQIEQTDSDVHDVSIPDQENMDLNQDFSNLNPFENLQNQPIEEPLAADLSPFGTVASEIVNFANQNEAIGVLTYDLTVAGLDTKETVSVFREAVEDSKFGWLPQDIVIKNGECVFKNLNPVRAFIIAKRIQFLDIEMQWRQNVQV